MTEGADEVSEVADEIFPGDRPVGSAVTARSTTAGGAAGDTIAVPAAEVAVSLRNQSYDWDGCGAAPACSRTCCTPLST